eukprot:m.3164 g.3164  ORF g.3164 m.3164 type:complete len:1718 (+) comp9087_c0_seq1:208-5361(+)
MATTKDVSFLSSTFFFIAATLWVVNSATALAARQLCTKDVGKLIDESVISFCPTNITNFSRILVDAASSQVAIATKANLFLVPLDLNQTQAKQHTSASTSMDKSFCTIQLPAKSCNNFFKVLLKDPLGSGLFACGTNANKPKCAFYSLSDLSDVTPVEWQAVSNFKGYCPGDPTDSNTAVITSQRKVLAGSNDGRGYQIGLHGTSGKSISTPVTDSDANNWLNNPHVDFVSSYEVGDHVFFFFREVALEARSQYTYSRVARVCKDDVGDFFLSSGNWKTFLKARISCSVPSADPAYHYNHLVATSYVKNALYNPNAKTQDVVYALFTGTPGTPSGSAVCAFGLSGSYAGDLSSVYGSSYWLKNSDSLWHTDTKKAFTCTNPKTQAADYSYILVSTDVKQATSGPLVAIDGVTATSIAVDRVQAAGGIELDVFFLGFDDGTVKKVVQIADGSGWKSKVVETIALDIEEAIIQLEILGGNDLSKRQLYGVTNSKVATIPLERCSRLTTCRKCIESQDPYCGWSSSKASCVAFDGVVAQNVTDGDYTSVCPKPPATYTIKLDSSKSASSSLYITWKPNSSPPPPYSSPSFRLYQNGELMGNVSSKESSYNFTSLSPYTEYSFSIVPVNDFGDGEESNIVTALTRAAAPVSPVLRGTAFLPRQVDLVWNQPLIANGPLSKYEIYSAEVGQKLLLASSFLNQHLVKDRLTYVDSTVKPETNFTYQLTTCTKDSLGEYCSTSKPVIIETPCDRPSAPINVQATTINHTTIQLTWDPPVTPNGLLYRYRIQKNPHGEYVSSCCNGTQTSAFVTNLNSFTKYSFSVAGLTCAGYGPESIAVVATTAAGPPGKPASPVLSSFSSNNSISVRWGPPDVLEGNVKRYELCRQPGRCKMFSALTFVYYDGDSVKACEEYTYTVKVVADGGESVSDGATMYVVGTLGNVTHLSSVSSAWEIGLQWDSPVQGLCTVDYFSVYQGVVETKTKFTSYFVSGLSPATSYSFSIAAATTAGVGPYTNVTITTADARPAQPFKLTATFSGGGNLGLSWNAPSPNYGTPVKYHVSELYGGFEQEVTTLSFQVPSSWIPVAGRSYTFYVSAENSAGRGPAANVVVTVNEKKPGSPENVFAIASGKASVKIGWLPPPWQNTNGKITGYKIEQVKPTVAPVKTVSAARTNIDLSGLSPGTLYAFRVSAQTSAGYGTTMTSNDVETEKDLVPATCKPVIATAAPTTKVQTKPPVSTVPVPPGTVSPTAAQLTALTVSSLEISVVWKMPSNAPESDVARVVVWRESETSGLIWTPRVEICCTGYQLAKRVTSLLPYTKYRFTLGAVMKSGMSRLNLALDEARTNQAAPAPPTNVGATATSPATVTLVWNEPNPENGIVSSYEVFVDGKKHVTNPKLTATTTIVPGLEPFTTYGFKVRALTDSDSLVGDFSAAVDVQTATAKPAKLPSPIVASASTTTVFASWNQPSLRTGIVTSYRLYWHRKMEEVTCTSPEGRINETMRPFTNPRQLNTEVRNLQVGTTYCFAVDAATSAGYGPKSDYTSVTTFSLASIEGGNLSCPNTDILRQYIKQLLVTSPPPEVPTIAVEQLTGEGDGNTIVIIVGVVAGLAMITTLVLGILLFVFCRRGEFGVSDFISSLTDSAEKRGRQGRRGENGIHVSAPDSGLWARRVSSQIGNAADGASPPPTSGRAPSGLYEAVIPRTTSKTASSEVKDEGSTMFDDTTM